MRIIKKTIQTLILCLGPVTASFAQSCYTNQGCSNYGNFGFNSTVASTLEYDNYISAFHSTVVRDIDGTLKIWGEDTKANGTDDWLVPTAINAGNYPGLTGTPLKVAMGSNGQNTVQSLLLTSDNKLWAWGMEGSLVDASLTTSRAFQQVSIGLPTGVMASDVKMLFGTLNTVLLTTCTGDVYALAAHVGVRGDGGVGAPTAWSHVEKESGGFLSGIVAARAHRSGVLALDASGQLWVWGYSWDGITPNAILRNKAVLLSKPAGAIKMIGVGFVAQTFVPSYYVLYENGNLYAMGGNSSGQLGNWNTTDQPLWIQPRYNSATGPVMNDIKWISPNEHDYSYIAINVINNDKKVFNWGTESGYMLGRGTNLGITQVTPGEPVEFEAGYANSNIIGVETGGHTTMVLRECSSTFGYVGHRISGSMGDNSAASIFDPTYHFKTNALQVCGAQTVTSTLSASVNGPNCIGNIVQLIGSPSGGTYAIDPTSTATATLSGNTLTFTGAGTLRVTYTVNDAGCGGTAAIVKVFVVENCGSKVTIPGTVWNDADGDAIKDTEENGISNGLWVNLVAPNGTVIASAMVNTDGTYTFQVGTGYLATSGNYSVVLTNGAQNVGDPLTTADTPTGGYGYTGVNRGATGVDNTNRTGKLNIGNLSTVTGGTTTNPVNFGISNDPIALPVQFTDISAVIKGSVLFVNWSTASEKNNKRFEIEASVDGVHFVTIGVMPSKAQSGNADTVLSYEFSTELSTISLAASGIGLALLVLGSLALGLQRKRKLLFAGMMLTGVFIGAVGCQKKVAEPIDVNKNAYVRIAQIDQNGSKSYSKIVKVITNN